MKPQTLTDASNLRSVATPVRRLGEPGGVRIRLTASLADEEAKRLITAGGECNSFEVMEAIVRRLGLPDSGNKLQKQLCFCREGASPVDFDYQHFHNAITCAVEVRESATSV